MMFAIGGFFLGFYLFMKERAWGAAEEEGQGDCVLSRELDIGLHLRILRSRPELKKKLDA